MRILFHIGRYFMLMGETFARPERWHIYVKRTLEEIDLLGVRSLGIVALLSVFMPVKSAASRAASFGVSAKA